MDLPTKNIFSQLPFFRGYVLVFNFCSPLKFSQETWISDDPFSTGTSTAINNSCWKNFIQHWWTTRHLPWPLGWFVWGIDVAFYWPGLIKLGDGFKYFLFSPLLGEDSHSDQYFSDGLKPPTRMCLRSCLDLESFHLFLWIWRETSIRICHFSRVIFWRDH